MYEKLLGLLGISRKAGKIVFGFEAVSKGIVLGDVKLALVASDASPRTKRAVRDSCGRVEIEWIEPGCTMEQLGNAIGKGNTAVLGLTDQKLSDRAKEICHAD